MMRKMIQIIVEMDNTNLQFFPFEVCLHVILLPTSSIKTVLSIIKKSVHFFYHSQFGWYIFEIRTKKMYSELKEV